MAASAAAVARRQGSRVLDRASGPVAGMAAAAAAAAALEAASSWDPLFLALAPAWARAHRPSSTEVRQQAHRSIGPSTSTSTSARRAFSTSAKQLLGQHSGPSHRSARDEAGHARARGRQLAAQVASSSAPRSNRQGRKAASGGAAPELALPQNALPTKSLNNYLLMLGREYRTPPPAYVFEAVRVLRNACLVQHQRTRHSGHVVLDPFAPSMGPDRMTFEIVLDLIARAIPMHNELNRTLAAEKRREKLQKGTVAAAGAARAKPEPVPGRENRKPSKAKKLDEYGVSRRLSSFTEQDVHAEIEQTTASSRFGHFKLFTFARLLTEILEKPQNASFKTQNHYFLQAEDNIERAMDADDATYHPVPSRISKHKLAALIQEGKQEGEAARPDKEVSTSLPRNTPPKTPAQVFLNLFEVIYEYMFHRTSDRSMNCAAGREKVTCLEFATSKSERTMLLYAGRIGPLGPTAYAYTARAMCYQRVRDWDEVRATVRECLGRATWKSPIIFSRHRNSHTARDSDRNGRSVINPNGKTLPPGWTVGQAEDLVSRLRQREGTMLNRAFLTFVLWAWVRSQAPSAPFSVPLDEWELSDDDFEVDLAASKEEQPSIGSDLPGPTQPALSADGKAAIEVTLRRVRDVYDLLRDNVMRIELERLDQEEGQDQPSFSSDAHAFGAPATTTWMGHGGAQDWLALGTVVNKDPQEAGVERDLAKIARIGRSWTMHQQWLHRMRVLLHWDKRRMEEAKARAQNSTRALSPLPQSTVPSKQDRQIEGEEGEEEDQHSNTVVQPRRKVRCSYAQTLREIYGIPTHPAVLPHLPPSIVPDMVTYAQFIRLFTHLGDWQQATEVLADYEQTPLFGPGQDEEDHSSETALPRRDSEQRVCNEATLPMLDAFFRGYCLHVLPPMPNNPAHVAAELARVQERVKSALRQLGLDDPAVPVETLDASEILSFISPRGRGWTLESLVFVLEIYLRIRPDCGPNSVRRRQEAREMAYQQSLAARRRAQEATLGASYGVRPYQYEGASPTPAAGAMSGQRPFFERNVRPEMPLAHSRLETGEEVRSVMNTEEGSEDAWIGRIGHSILDRVYGPSATPGDFASNASASPISRLKFNIPDRVTGTTPTVLEVDANGGVRGFYPAPVPRQLFWVLTALRRATSDHVPGWVLEQWTRVLNKFGPDPAVYDRLWEEERRRIERKQRQMHARPEMAAWDEGGLEELLDVEEEAAAEDWDGSAAASGKEAELRFRFGGRGRGESAAEWQRNNGGVTNVELYGTGRQGSEQKDTGTRTDANHEGWYAWKFPQRRTNRVLQYLALRIGRDPDTIRYS
ncbi:hypothetical protein OC835_001737 [Tilletia horrida]|nr:hypothetical protein OC835_001737 [Tilletia horrida]